MQNISTPVCAVRPRFQTLSIAQGFLLFSLTLLMLVDVGYNSIKRCKAWSPILHPLASADAIFEKCRLIFRVPRTLVIWLGDRRRSSAATLRSAFLISLFFLMLFAVLPDRGHTQSISLLCCAYKTVWDRWSNPIKAGGFGGWSTINGYAQWRPNWIISLKLHQSTSNGPISVRGQWPIPALVATFANICFELAHSLWVSAAFSFGQGG